jgi:V/A-type H+-transporting ATPase subunit G/H
MSLEAIQTITQTEKAASQQIQSASDQAKKLISDAEKTGQAKVVQARAEAEAKVRTMMEQAEAKAAQQGTGVMDEMKRSCDALRKAAEGRLPAAAELIVRRVVNV